MYKEEHRMKFADARKLAIANGCPDNKTTIGIWLKFNGYIKKESKDRNRKNYYYYVKSHDDLQGKGLHQSKGIG